MFNRRQFLGAGAAAMATAMASRQADARESTTTQPSPDRRPNVLWLVSEDMGCDLSCYGETAIHTPNIDRLAREGTRYLRAYASCPVCSPSRSAFCTGMYATSIGAHNHRTDQVDKQALPEGVQLISQQFAAAGYFTCLMNAKKEDWNFVRPKDAWMGDDWKGRADGQPFFAMINFSEPHRFVWEKEWPALKTHIDPATVVVPSHYPDTRVQRESQAKYLDLIVEMDRKLGEIVARLEAEGQLDNTIIFYFGDNGRTFYADKRFCHEGGLSVPLVARYPGVFAPNSVSGDLVSLIDLASTSLALCGIKRSARTDGTLMREAGGTPREYVFAARDRLDGDLNLIRSVRDTRWKYIRNYQPEVGYPQAGWVRKAYPEYREAERLHREGKLTPRQDRHFAASKPREELYDLELDPLESDNLAEKPELKPTLDRLRAAIDAWLAQTNDTGLAAFNAMTEKK